MRLALRFFSRGGSIGPDRAGPGECPFEFSVQADAKASPTEKEILWQL